MKEPILTEAFKEALRKHYEKIFAKAYAPRKIYNFTVRFKARFEEIREDLWW
jgi:hypothetical protein